MSVKTILKYLMILILASVFIVLAFLVFSVQGKYLTLRFQTRGLPVAEKAVAYAGFAEKYPLFQTVKLKLAEYYLTMAPGDQEKLDAAIAQYNAVLASRPENTDALGKLADISFMQKDFPKAIENYIRILELTPEDNDTRKKLAMALYYSEDREQASKELEKALAKDPEAPELNMINAIVLEQDGDLAGAISGYRKAAVGYAARKLAPLAADAYQRLGLAYLKTGLFFDAAGALKNSIRYNPQAVLPHVELAAAYLNLHMFNNAIKAIQSSPLNIEGWKSPASMQEAMIDKRLKSYVYDVLAKSYLQLGDQKKALEYFREAKSTGAEYPDELFTGIEQRISARWKEQSAAFKPGNTVTGTVRAMSDKGVTVDLEGGVEGFIDSQDLSWSSLPVDITNRFSIGGEIKAQVLGLNDEKETVNIGIKQLSPDPWISAADRYKEGDKVKGPVIYAARGGVYVKLDEDVEGYIGADDISWTENITDASGALPAGQEVEAIVLSVNVPLRKISLGVKQLEPDPWVSGSANFKKDQRVKGPVIKTAATGAVVDLGGGIKGFIHNRDVSWTRNIILSSDAFTAGDQVEAIVLGIDDTNRRVILGVKQLEPDPWEHIKEKYIPGTEFTGTITRVSPFGVHVQLEDGLEAIYPLYQIAPSRTNALGTYYPSGEDVNIVVRSVDPVEKKILVLIKETEKDEE